ncbi:23S rRNA (adenine(2030)-N(6))-methyltransferase RlmJ [Thalassolituus sp.]|uniref:23S rRNA (adenine(2030)-N(6))-methyltransferase RlmJ n=1 Tax=Thalassolituus sp. TaxID=2030822 RepID=UPI0032D8BF1B
MLSYRHSFHAGNFADVLKHQVLVHVLRYMGQKDKPYAYIDTHAGAGVYALSSTHATKNREFDTGIGPLREDQTPELNDYLQTVVQCDEAANKIRTSREGYYPGSPEIARQWMRPYDKGFLYELHSTDFDLLNDHLGRDRRFIVEQSDGFQGLIARLPPQSRRGVVLMDPPYELKSDYDNAISTLVKAHKRFATGVFALWYPVVERERVHRMEAALIKSGIRNIQLFELGIGSDTLEHGMTSSGMIVINPPWTLKAELDKLLPYLASTLSAEGVWRSEVLVQE